MYVPNNLIYRAKSLDLTRFVSRPRPFRLPNPLVSTNIFRIRSCHPLKKILCIRFCALDVEDITMEVRLKVSLPSSSRVGASNHRFNDADTLSQLPTCSLSDLRG